MNQLNETLRQLFESHGVEALVQGDWVVFPNHPFRAGAKVTQEIPQQGAVLVQLDVRLKSNDGRTLIESFGGVGANSQDAMQDALHNFVSNSFHVWLVAFFGVKAEDNAQVTQETWRHEGRAHRITRGPLGARGKMPVEGAASADPMDALIEEVKRRPLSPGTHWIRLYYAQCAGETVSCEALLDNEEWPQIQDEMAHSAWPTGSEFYSLRVFFVLQVQKGGEVSPQTAVSWLVQLIAAREQFDEDAVLAELQQLGVPPKLAERAFRFTQIAWVRPLLEQAIDATFTSDYQCFDLSSNLVEDGQLAQEACFVAAIQIAPFYMGTPGFRWLTLCSAEMQIVNNAVKEGVAMADMKGANVSSPQLYLRHASR